MVSPQVAPTQQITMLQKFTLISHHANSPYSSFWFNIVSFRKLTFDELRIVVKKFQLLMILSLTDSNEETEVLCKALLHCIKLHGMIQ